MEKNVFISTNQVFCNILNERLSLNCRKIRIQGNLDQQVQFERIELQTQGD